MNKEEVLMKSRQEKTDEGMTAAEAAGRKIGITAFCIVFVIITLFNFFNGESNYGPMAMFWAFLAAEAYPKYRFTKNKAYLITVVAGAIASIAYILCVIVATLKG